MFHAVRQWWGSGRGKVTARLFLFEFVVVMVGVLAAQALQNTVQHRGAIGQMEDDRSRILRELSGNLARVRVWKVAIPCLDQRMQAIMRQAATAPLDPALIARPSLTTFIPGTLGDESELLLRARHGDRAADLIKGMLINVDHASNDISTMVHSWGRLSLADPSLGPVSPQDRAEARSAADIRAELRGLAFAIDDFSESASAARLATGIGDPGTRPARNCAEIWTAAATAVPR